MSVNTRPQAVKRLKRPWLAALLNLVFSSWGLGYVYLGAWTRFLLVLGYWVLSLALSGTDLAPLTWLVGLIIPIITAIDAWRLATAHNAALLSRETMPSVSARIPPLSEPMVSEEAGMDMPWESEIASDLSFRDRVTPEMLSHVPKEKQAWALREYARLHPDEAYWDGEALVRKGKGGGAASAEREKGLAPETPLAGESILLEGLHPAFMHNDLVFRQEGFLFGLTFNVYDERGKLLLVATPNLHVYLDEGKKEEVLTIEASGNFIVGYTYRVRDAITGKAAGSIKSPPLIGVEWVLFSGQDEEARITSRGRLRDLIPFLTQTYVIESRKGREEARISIPLFGAHTMKITQPEPSIDRRLLISLGLLFAKHQVGKSSG